MKKIYIFQNGGYAVLNGMELAGGNTPVYHTEDVTNKSDDEIKQIIDKKKKEIENKK